MGLSLVSNNCLLLGLAELSQQSVHVMLKLSPEVSTDKSDKINKNSKIDMKTVSHYIILGGAVFAPVMHVWYKWIDKAFPGKVNNYNFILSFKSFWIYW